jgi:hypothetical protein
MGFSGTKGFVFPLIKPVCSSFMMSSVPHEIAAHEGAVPVPFRHIFHTLCPVPYTSFPLCLSPSAFLAPSGSLCQFSPPLFLSLSPHLNPESAPGIREDLTFRAPGALALPSLN